jgi:short chain dehydrogenase
MNISFENKVALVTGAGSGLGLATAKAFAQSGASVALADANENSVRSAAGELSAQGYKALAIQCDVADDAQVERMVEQTVATFGRLDAAYNNAGVQNTVAEAADATREDFDRVDIDQSAGRVELHEVRAAPDAEARRGRYRQLFFDRRTGGRPQARNIPGLQTWRAWANQKRRIGLCSKRHPDQCRVPGHHSYGDARQDDGHSGGCP